MFLHRLLVLLVLTATAVSAYSTVTVATSTTYVYPTATAPSTPTPTPTTRTTSSGCVGFACGSTSCLPSTTKLIHYLCNDRCLGKSTSTSTVITYPPPVTATVPCGIKYQKRLGEEPDLEKRWTCAPGPTITTSTNLPCTACKAYPHSTTVTSSVFSTTTLFQTCPSATPTPTPSFNTSVPPLPTWSLYCFWLCTNSSTRTTIYNSASITTAGWDWCAQACT